MFFLSCHEHGTNKKILSPHEELNLRPLDSTLQYNALPMRHRYSAVSKVYYKVHMTHVMRTARISNVNSLMFVNKNKRDGKF